MTKTIALLTDFGTDDIYVGVMKGVMQRICPGVQLIDITHNIAPQSVRAGALALLKSYPYFPLGTVFLVVIDPGVGSARAPIAVQAGGYTFIAPNNGVLSYTLAELGDVRAVALQNDQYQLPRVSNTFHGRDVFAPAAAYLARGSAKFEDFGELVEQLMTIPKPHLQVEPGQLTGEVVHMDRFGNIITNIGVLRWVDEARLLLEEQGQRIRIPAQTASISLHAHTIYGIQRAYYEVLRGELLAQVDSNGYLEIAINQGDAASRTDASIGDLVVLRYG